MPIAVENKRVVYKQVGYGLYSTLSYVLSVVCVHLPLAATETVSERAPRLQLMSVTHARSFAVLTSIIYCKRTIGVVSNLGCY